MHAAQPNTHPHLGLIQQANVESLAGVFHTIAEKARGKIHLIPKGMDWDDYTFKREALEPLINDPALSIDEALRWCVVADGIPECNFDTAGVVRLERETGYTLIDALCGPSHDHATAISMIARDLEARQIDDLPIGPKWADRERQKRKRRTVDVDITTEAPLPAPTPVPANDNKATPSWPGIISSGELVKGFVAPDYQIEGVAQAGFVYSMTAMTGTGKTAVNLLVAAHTALGISINDREVRQGRVVYFAGENPDDVTMRWIAMAHHMEFDPEAIDVHFIKGTFSIPGMFKRITANVTKLGGAQLIVVDTSAAYFEGDDENNNTQNGRHARNLRTLTTLPGAPCVLVPCHPIKSADTSNLLPRGGGAFLNEMDGNLVLIKGDAGTVRMHWHGKHRGPDFEPIHFELHTVEAPLLKDSKGRDIPTVMATPLSTGETRQRRVQARKDEDEVLLQIENDGRQSLHDIAARLCWQKKGKPHKDRVRLATDKLRKEKLVTYESRKWKLTAAGQDVATECRNDRHKQEQAANSVGRMVANERAKTA